MAFSSGLGFGVLNLETRKTLQPMYYYPGLLEVFGIKNDYMILYSTMDDRNAQLICCSDTCQSLPAYFTSRVQNIPVRVVASISIFNNQNT